MYEAFIRECDRNGCMYKVYHLGVWKRKRRKVIKDFHNECYDCKLKGIITNGTKKHPLEVHHIKPIQTEEGWVLRLEYSNTMSVCLECHNYYHNRFQRKVMK